MSNQITVGFSEEYSANIELLLQQKRSYFRTATRSRMYGGKSAQVVQQLGAVTATKRTARHADTPISQTPHDSRWVHPVDYEWADYIDKQDELRAVTDFTSSYVMNGTAAANRAIDDEVIGAFFSNTTKTGEDQGTTVSWDAFTSANPNHKIAATATGMTVAKLRQAKKALMAAEVDVDREMLWCALSAEQHEDLLEETQTTSMDFNSTRTLIDGRIKSFMGFNFIDSERLPDDGAGNRRCPIWAESGMALGIWGDVKGRIDELPGKSYSKQVYVCTTIGATRVEEEKIVEVLCAE